MVPGRRIGRLTAVDTVGDGASRDGWLEERLREVPPRLAAAIRRLVVPQEDDAEGLARSALRGFVAVAGDGSQREGALELLAADALLTYAFERAADPDAGGSADAALDLAARVRDEIMATVERRTS